MPLGVTRNTVMGQLKLPTQGVEGGILIGEDAQFYRSAANILYTPDSIEVLGTITTAGGVVYFGTASGVSLTKSAPNKLALGTGDTFFIRDADKIEFRDAAIFISSKNDGHLDLDADVSIDLNGTVNVGEAADSVGFMGKAAVTQQAHEADPTDLTTCITAITSLIDKLKAYGLLAADP